MMTKSVAFKCTYNDGGEDILVGFNGTCTDNNIIQNIKNSRAWCSNDDCGCRQYYDRGMKGRRPVDPCYESVLFREWKFSAGVSHKGPRAGSPTNIRKVQPGGFAILTTRFPGEREEDRKIVGLFRIDEIDEKSGTTVICTNPEHGIRLPLEEARSLFYWAYGKTRTGETRWDRPLFRYLDDRQVDRILTDLLETTCDADISRRIRNLISESFGGQDPPPPDGCLPERSTERAEEIAQARKYGSGGEGEEHKKLKKWISEHPEAIGLANVLDVFVEHKFLTGDTADIVFVHRGGSYSVVEVETDVPLPGVHQVVKYRALLCADKKLPLATDRVRGILVAWSIPWEVQEFCGQYAIDAQKLMI